MAQHPPETADPAPAPSLDERLAARLGDLTRTEQRVARYFAEHPAEAAFRSAVEIARHLGTSDATVVRTAQALGYAGLPALKRELAAMLRARATPAALLDRSLDTIGDHPEAALDHVVLSEIEFLDAARRTVDRAAFGRALELLDGADRVLVFGIGPSAKLAEYAALQLVRFGRQATALTMTGLRLADELIGMRRGDVLVAVMYGRIYHELEVALDHARGLDVPVVLLTDAPGTPLARRVAATLAARRGRSGLLNTRATTLVLLDGLLLGLAAKDRPRALATLERLNDLRARLVGYRVDVVAEGAERPGRR